MGEERRLGEESVCAGLERGCGCGTTSHAGTSTSPDAPIAALGAHLSHPPPQVGGGQLNSLWLCAVLRSKLPFLESSYWRYLRTTRGSPPLPQLLRDIGGGHPRLAQILDEAEHDARMARAQTWPGAAGADRQNVRSAGTPSDDASGIETVRDSARDASEMRLRLEPTLPTCPSSPEIISNSPMAVTRPSRAHRASQCPATCEPDHLRFLSHPYDSLSPLLVFEPPPSVGSRNAAGARDHIRPRLALGATARRAAPPVSPVPDAAPRRRTGDAGLAPASRGGCGVGGADGRSGGERRPGARVRDSWDGRPRRTGEKGARVNVAECACCMVQASQSGEASGGRVKVETWWRL